MDKTERLFKLSIDVLFFTPSFLILSGYTTVLVSAILAAFLAHSLNWILNGQFFVVLKNANLLDTEPERFSTYLCGLKARASVNGSVLAVAVIGSLSRGTMGEGSSDIDVRVIRKKGLLNGVMACYFLMKERTRALLRSIPLDIYVFDSIDAFEARTDPWEFENGVVLHDPWDFLARLHMNLERK